MLLVKLLTLAFIVYLYIKVIRSGTFLEGNNLIVFYYLCAFEICIDMKSGVWWEGHYKRRTTVIEGWPLMGGAL